jgi:flagellar biosynthesis component FlhA
MAADDSPERATGLAAVMAVLALMPERPSVLLVCMTTIAFFLSVLCRRKVKIRLVSFLT